MTTIERSKLIAILARRQDWKCSVCGKPLANSGPLEVAHRIPRGRIVRLVGKAAEWDIDAVELVCTRRGKTCNDAALLPIGVARDDLIKRLKEKYSE